jgi:hypothetical protein
MRKRAKMKEIDHKKILLRKYLKSALNFEQYSFLEDQFTLLDPEPSSIGSDGTLARVPL